VSATILVVDDDGEVRESIRAVLHDEGYRVTTAHDGSEAVRRVIAERPHLVILDVWMPEVDGIQVLAQLQAVSSTIPVVVISGHGNVDVAVKATRLGAVDFVEKPFSIDTLLAVIRRALNQNVDPGRGRDLAVDAPPRSAAAPSLPRVRQRTLGRSVVGGGLGLHSGVRTGMILHPLPPDSGIRFGRVGSEGYVEARVDHDDSTGYATTLYKDGLVVRTVEHLLATLHAYGVTNLFVKVDGEVPILDGSAAELCDLVESAGIVEQPATVPIVQVENPIRIDAGDGRLISIEPCDRLRITYDLVYPAPVGEQSYTFELTDARAFREQIAPARTFGFVEEIRALEAAGLGQGGQLGNVILIGEQGIVNTALRFPEELARHKILDLLGDTYLLGHPLRGAIHARKTGHAHNVDLVKRIRAAWKGSLT